MQPAPAQNTLPERSDWLSVPESCSFAHLAHRTAGVVGDIESAPFVEALRQFQFRVGPSNFCCVHVSLVPVLGVVGEQKTKPTQHSVSVLRSLGLSPHLLACRSQEPLGSAAQEKLVGPAPSQAWSFWTEELPVL